jgi:hypothetical protein
MNNDDKQMASSSTHLSNTKKPEQNPVDPNKGKSVLSGSESDSSSSEGSGINVFYVIDSESLSDLNFKNKNKVK